MGVVVFPLFNWSKRGEKKIRLYGELGSPEFWGNYRQACEGILKPKEKPNQPMNQDTLNWLRLQYLANSDDFKNASLAWRSVRQRHLDLVCEYCGHVHYKDLRRRHIIKIRDELKQTSGGKNNLIKHLRGLFAWAIEVELLDQNPTDNIKKIKVSKPHKTMTLSEMKQYLERHGPGTKARFGMMLAFWTHLRVNDIARAGRQHIRNGRLVLTPNKTTRSSGVTIDLALPDPLLKEIDNQPRKNLALMAKEDGSAYTVKGLANRYKDWFVQAGLEHLSVHAIRKGAATILAENGATENQLMARLGWTTHDQPSLYTREANRRKLADESDKFLEVKWNES
jgi:integrase